jgi:hypothetical protein
MAKAKRPSSNKIAELNRASRTIVKISGSPVSSYVDAHGDNPPYHDQHSDGGTYYDHPDTEHNDFHVDESGKNVYKGDPIELVSDTMARLEGLLAKFEAVQRQSLERAASEMSSKLKEMDARIAAIQLAVKQLR